jgi:hypothetical protein
MAGGAEQRARDVLRAVGLSPAGGPQKPAIEGTTSELRNESPQPRLDPTSRHLGNRPHVMRLLILKSKTALILK